MSDYEQKPLTIGGQGFHHDEDVTTHPAFGKVELTRRHGSTRLFGSELVHHETMHVTVYRAKNVRNLNSDRVSEDGGILCEFDFSLAQWAQFVASQGMGSGTPCTLNSYRTEGFVQAPGIAATEEIHVDKFRREMKQAIDERTAGITGALDELAAALEKGGKVAMREALKEARRHAEQLPGSVDFVNRQFAESVEHIVSDAKTEVEGFVVGMAMRTGIKALADAAPQIGLIASSKEQP